MPLDINKSESLPTMSPMREEVNTRAKENVTPAPKQPKGVIHRVFQRRKAYRPLVKRSSYGEIVMPAGSIMQRNMELLKKMASDSQTDLSQLEWQPRQPTPPANTTPANTTPENTTPDTTPAPGEKEPPAPSNIVQGIKNYGPAVLPALLPALAGGVAGRFMTGSRSGESADAYRRRKRTRMLMGGGLGALLASPWIISRIQEIARERQASTNSAPQVPNDVRNTG
jgi:hypothetical protein